MAYLSTQNIAFQKGLARKLIPKFIGPYKIIRDYGNSSFKIDLPTELKKRGVHDVFHSSLLRIHLPNDDRLFPGRQEKQLGHSSKIEEEWAVEEILTHHQAHGDTIFEVKWKAGDVTWLPNYEISYLQVLKNYLDAQGVDQIGQLPPGKGNPLLSDPQVLLNFTKFELSTSRKKPGKVYKYQSNLFHLPSLHPAILTSLHLSSLPRPPLIEHFDTAMAKRPRSLPSINHPCFSKRSRHLIQVSTTSGNLFFHV